MVLIEIDMQLLVVIDPDLFRPYLFFPHLVSLQGMRPPGIPDPLRSRPEQGSNGVIPYGSLGPGLDMSSIFRPQVQTRRLGFGVRVRFGV